MVLRYSQWRYYLQFLYYKLRIIIDCSEGRFRLLLSVLIHFTDVLCGVRWEMPGFNRIETIKTIWGKFQFIGDLYSYLILNPSFERSDMEYFLEQIRIALAKRKKVLFLDIGANVGLYTIGLTNRIGKNRFTVHAFEPDPVYHTLLLNNIAINDIKGVVVHNVAVGEKNRTIESAGFRLVKDRVERSRVRFRIRTLDSIITSDVIRRCDKIFVKIDIEGHEEEALRGAVQLFRSQKPVVFMIEDCVNPSIQTYLKAQKFTFRGKITPYNSFWELH